MTTDERLATVRAEIETILRRAKPGFELGEAPLSELTRWLKDAPWPGWRNIETGFLKERTRRELIAKTSATLLAEIEKQSPSDPLNMVNAMREVYYPLQFLQTIAQYESEQFPPPEPQGYKTFARIFYNLVVQTWLEGGASYNRGTLPQFGRGKRSPAITAVCELLAMAGRNVGQATLAATLANEPDPQPYTPSNKDPFMGRDFEAWCRGEWEWDDEDKRRIYRNKSEHVVKSEATEPKKKRGRPTKIPKN